MSHTQAINLSVHQDVPPKPAYVLRGHKADVRCLDFFDFDTEAYLISGDADGEVVVWSLARYREVIRWKAHSAAVLGIKVHNDQVITHGKDNKVYLWAIVLNDLSGNASLDSPGSQESCLPRPPFMLCALDVNSMGFRAAAFHVVDSEILVAAPSPADEKVIDLCTLPSCKRLVKHILPPNLTRKLGMVMCLDINYPDLMVGYEDGSVAHLKLAIEHVSRETHQQNGTFQLMALWKVHRDAMLSVKIDSPMQRAYSSGIDSVIVEYNLNDNEENPVLVNTKHSGQQSLVVRADHKLFATGCWNGSIRIYSCKKRRSIAVLKWHKSSVHCVALRPAGHTLAAGSKDCKISLWSIY